MTETESLRAELKSAVDAYALLERQFKMGNREWLKKLQQKQYTIERMYEQSKKHADLIEEMATELRLSNAVIDDLRGQLEDLKAQMPQ